MVRRARVSRPERSQVEMQLLALDEMLPADHRARIVWRFVESIDLEPLYADIQVSDHQAGRSAIAPEILVAVWLLATLDGIGTARELDRRCESDIAYKWICGGVSVNYHTLSDFRTEHAEFLEQLLTDTVASLIDRGLVPLDTIAQDGMRVRANAGGSSFRRKPTLEKLRQQAKQHVERLKEESESESARQQADERRRAARQRAAEEQQERVEEAIRQVEELAQQREKRKKGDGQATRCSTTDPDARRMKMGDGGWRPGYNVQFASDGDARVIVAVEVTNSGSDGGQMAPLHETICERYQKTPEHLLVDSAYATIDDVTAVEQRGTKVVSTVPHGKVLERNGKDPHSRQRRDTDQYADFRARMANPAYKEMYKQRPSIAEFPNADCRNRKLHQFQVRGQLKVKAVALWHALAFNFMRMLNLKVIA